MKDYILLGDFGSTYSKFCLVQTQTAKIIAKDTRPTTVQTSIVDCYQAAKQALIQASGLPITDDQLEEYFSSSAWGGYKMVVVGFTLTLSQEAAKRAALGAGTRILKTYAYGLDQNKLAEIQSLAPDVILLTGGSNGGNTRFVIECAQQISQYFDHMDVIFAGNQEAIPQVQAAFEGTHNRLFITDNVMPVVDELDVEPVRQVAREIFMDKILHTNGLNEIAKHSSQPIIPTPSAVLETTKLISQSLNQPIMVVDIGGATTDVHSYSQGYSQRQDIVFEGLKEPQLKRTVEGDLGMRLSAQSVLSCVTPNQLAQALPDWSLQEIEASLQRRTQETNYIADNDKELNFDLLIAQIATNIASSRHVGSLRKVNTPNQATYYQRGKNLQDVFAVIGTGGILVHHPQAKDILKYALANDDMDLRPLSPLLWQDKDYLLSLMGILGQFYPELAMTLLDNHLRQL
ncbi:glutamate mutase L [Vaginisenegalia massiliensis]|uniref:glutamate mutase L n=1 Tax=Vaginisenegalia massiliensis TaxID=2058294 RepID=UPI0013DD9426|nr:glutamate mutase L [Vaginisenegalia massiliensis]